MSSTSRAPLSALFVCTALLTTACNQGSAVTPPPATGANAAAAPAAASAKANPITGEGLPNPAPNVTRNWGQLPAGRKWGTSAGIDIDPKDGQVWAYERCGAGTAGGGPVDCENNPVDPVFKFDRTTGAVLANIGKGVMVTPHGIHVDKDGNVWIADFAGNIQHIIVQHKAYLLVFHFPFVQYKHAQYNVKGIAIVFYFGALLWV